MTVGVLGVVLRWIAIVALWGFLAGVFQRVLVLFLKEMRQSEANPKPGVWIEANWGGLGGGISGWRVSNAIIYLLVMSLLLGCLSLAVVTLTPMLGTIVETKEEEAKQKTSSTKKEDEKKATDQKDAEKKEVDQKPTEVKPSDFSGAGKKQSQSPN